MLYRMYIEYFNGHEASYNQVYLIYIYILYNWHFTKLAAMHFRTVFTHEEYCLIMCPKMSYFRWHHKYVVYFFGTAFTSGLCIWCSLCLNQFFYNLYLILVKHFVLLILKMLYIYFLLFFGTELELLATWILTLDIAFIVSSKFKVEVVE